MYKLLFLTILSFVAAISANVWGVINIALGGPMILSAANIVIAFLAFMSFVKMLGFLLSVIDARKLSRKLRQSRARSLIS